MRVKTQFDGVFSQVHINPAQVCAAMMGGTDNEPFYTLYMSNGEEYDIDRDSYDRIVEWIDGQ